MSEASSFERSEKLTVGGFGGAVSPPTGFEADSHKNLRSSSKNDLIWRFLDTFECIVLLEIMKHQTRKLTHFHIIFIPQFFLTDGLNQDPLFFYSLDYPFYLVIRNFWRE